MRYVMLQQAESWIIETHALGYRSGQVLLGHVHDKIDTVPEILKKFRGRLPPGQPLTFKVLPYLLAVDLNLSEWSSRLPRLLRTG